MKLQSWGHKTVCYIHVPPDLIKHETCHRLTELSTATCLCIHGNIEMSEPIYKSNIYQLIYEADDKEATISLNFPYHNVKCEVGRSGSGDRF